MDSNINKEHLNLVTYLCWVGSALIPLKWGFTPAQSPAKLNW